MSTSHRADSTDAARLSMALLYKQLMKATPRSRGFKIVRWCRWDHGLLVPGAADAL